MRAGLLILLLTPLIAFAENHDINVMSVKPGSGQTSTGGDSTNPSVSGDGNFVVFSSDAKDLTENDDDDFTDVFIVNRQTPTPIAVRISNDANGLDTDGNNDQPHISNDAEAVVFRSSATDLLRGPLHIGTPQIYLYNRIATPTPRATPIATVGPFALISANASGNGGDGESFSPKVSEGGRYVAFVSLAKNLVSPCSSGPDSHVFLFDASNSSSPLTCISKNSGGFQGNNDSYAPSISKDGNLIAYESTADNLTAVNTGGKKNIFLYNRGANTTTLVSSDATNGASNGDNSNPYINADGTYIVFDTNSTDIVANCPTSNARRTVILYKVADGSKSCASVDSLGDACNGDSVKAAVSGDGNVIAYLSDCINLLVPEAKKTPGSGIYDVYRSVRGTPGVTRENTTVAKAQATPGADNIAIDTDGSIIAFDTAAKLRLNDRNGLSDVYVTDQDCNTDSDGDGTVDCDDDCYLDPTKITGGTCGCGTSDVDTDGDGTLDCLDGCPTDSNKIVFGACGCGFADTDADSNSLADCLEPTTGVVPVALKATRQFSAGRVKLEVPGFYKGHGYTFTYELLDRNRRVISRKSSSAARITFSGLRLGTYYVRYRIKNGLGARTAFSKTQRIRFVR